MVSIEEKRRPQSVLYTLCVHPILWSGRHYQIMRSKLPLSYVRMYEKRM